MSFDEWKQDFQVVTVVGSVSVGGGIHEYGDWEVVGGGQEKVFKFLQKWKTRSRKNEEVWGCCGET
jgi:hypothetical protein